MRISNILYSIILFFLLHCVCGEASSQEMPNTSDSITVNFFLLEDCNICQYYSTTINQIYKDFKSDRVGFIGYFPNRYSSDVSILEFKEKYNIPFQLKKEFFQSKTKDYNATVTPEVVVYNETQKTVLYQGRIDNSFQKLGVRRRVVTKHELRDALEAIVKNENVLIANTVPVGCLITLLKD